MVISRDVIILVGFLVLFMITGRSIAIRPTFVGKACTFFQLLTVTQSLLSLHNPLWRVPWLWVATLALAGAATTVSGLQYLVRAVQWLNVQDEEPGLELRRESRSEGEAERRRYSA